MAITVDLGLARRYLYRVLCSRGVNPVNRKGRSFDRIYIFMDMYVYLFIYMHLYVRATMPRSVPVRRCWLRPRACKT